MHYVCSQINLDLPEVVRAINDFPCHFEQTFKKFKNDYRKSRASPEHQVPDEQAEDELCEDDGELDDETFLNYVVGLPDVLREELDELG